ncbi:hypothetical protein GOB57_09470 [Sinorhizobium meliloti]|nr:hypothetical protein [Sinorhizobium meliloti]
MDVKAFIFEATDKSLKVDAAIREVDTAKEAVEAARAAVEAAKAGVEAAKQGVVEAKAELDTYAERAEEFGLTRSKFKDAVERMKTLLADIGAVDAGTAETTDSVEPKQRVPRKRKGQDAGEQTTDQAAQTAATASAEATANTAPDEIAIGELADPDSITAAATAADAGHVELFVAADPQVEPTGPTAPVIEAAAVTAAASDEAAPRTPAAPTEIEEIANILLRPSEEVVTADFTETPFAAEVERAVETAIPAAAPQEEIEDDLDNSVAEQELLDFVDEVGTTDDDVKAVLSAAVKVVSWHTTNIAKTVLRTQPSPLTLAGVLVVEDAAYAPRDVQDAYTVALSFGGEKLAAAISWFNKSLDLLADAKPVQDFRFSEPAKAPRAKKEETAPVEGPVTAPEKTATAVVAASEDAPTANDTLDEVIDVTDEIAETIEDMQLFSEPEEAEDAAETVVPEPQVQPEVKPAPVAPPKVSKPSWLK